MPKGRPGARPPKGVAPLTISLLRQMLHKFSIDEYVEVNRLDDPTQSRLMRQPPWLIQALLEEGALVTAFNPSACVVLRMNQLRNTRLESIIIQFFDRQEKKEQQQVGFFDRQEKKEQQQVGHTTNRVDYYSVFR